MFLLMSSILGQIDKPRLEDMRRSTFSAATKWMQRVLIRLSSYAKTIEKIRKHYYIY